MSECASGRRGERLASLLLCLSEVGCSVGRRRPYACSQPHPVETSCSLMLHVKARVVVPISVPNSVFALVYFIWYYSHSTLLLIHVCLVYFSIHNIISLYNLLSEFLVNSVELHILFLSTLIISFLIGIFRLFKITFDIWI